MSFVQVFKIPVFLTPAVLKKELEKHINGEFHVLGFTAPAKNSGTKQGFLKLSEKCDAQEVVETIRSTVFSFGSVSAVVNHNVPEDIIYTHITGDTTSKDKLKKLMLAHEELLTELQFLYPSLYRFSERRKDNHQVLENLSWKIFDRLKVACDKCVTSVPSATHLTKLYRAEYPHSTDWLLLVGCVHEVEDAAGVTKTEIQEADLKEITKPAFCINKIPYENLNEYSTKYTRRIVSKLSEHIQMSDSSVSAADSKEVVARKRIRTEMKKMLPYFDKIVKQVVFTQLTPKDLPNLKIRIYGVPLLPPLEELNATLLEKHHAVAVTEGPLHSLVTCIMQPKQVSSLLAFDDSVIGGSKVVIRTDYQTTVYKTPYRVKLEMYSVIGVEAGAILLGAE